MSIPIYVANFNIIWEVWPISRKPVGFSSFPSHCSDVANSTNVSYLMVHWADLVPLIDSYDFWAGMRWWHSAILIQHLTDNLFSPCFSVSTVPRIDDISETNLFLNIKTITFNITQRWGLAKDRDKTNGHTNDKMQKLSRELPPMTSPRINWRCNVVEST